MNVPLNVVQDDQGRLRDVNDQPMVMIFDSKPKLPQISPRSKKPGPQPLAFINVTKPDKKDAGTQKLIKTHVMQNIHWRKKQKPGSGLKVFPQANLSLAVPRHPPGPGFVVFPVQMQPYMRRLIHQYTSSIMHIIDPKEPANPRESAWFPMVMTDPALFHAILCMSAIYIDLISGQQDSFPQRKHMLEAISLINARLQQVDAIECVSDATITTILFIAKAEYAQRNFTNWDIHMNGLKRIFNIRGGMMMLPNLIQQKAYYAELTGCIETGSIPRFQFVNDSITIGTSIATPPLTSPGFESLIQSHCLDRSFVTLLGEIEEYTYTFKISTPTAMDDLESTAVSIRYRLLSWINQSSVQDQRSIIQESVRFGAILYIKTLLQKPLVRGIDYQTMLSSLKSNLLSFESTRPTTTGLLLWLLFIGGIALKRSCRDWFIVKLIDVTAQAGIDTWEDARLLLVRFWWIEPIHEEPCQQLWEEVETMRVNAAYI